MNMQSQRETNKSIFDIPAFCGGVVGLLVSICSVGADVSAMVSVGLYVVGIEAVGPRVGL